MYRKDNETKFEDAPYLPDKVNLKDLDEDGRLLSGAEVNQYGNQRFAVYKTGIVGGEGAVDYIQNIQSGEWLAQKTTLPQSTIKETERAIEEAKKELEVNQLLNPLLADGFERDNADGERQYLMPMKLARGNKLEDIIKNEKLDQNEAILIAQNVVMEVQKLHSKNKAHRDLNLSQFMCDRQTGQVYLIDMGLAETIGQLGKINPIKGTPMYLPPEIIEKRIYDPKTETDKKCATDPKYQETVNLRDNLKNILKTLTDSRVKNASKKRKVEAAILAKMPVNLATGKLPPFLFKKILTQYAKKRLKKTLKNGDSPISKKEIDDEVFKMYKEIKLIINSEIGKEREEEIGKYLAQYKTNTINYNMYKEMQDCDNKIKQKRNEFMVNLAEEKSKHTFNAQEDIYQLGLVLGSELHLAHEVDFRTAFPKDKFPNLDYHSDFAKVLRIMDAKEVDKEKCPIKDEKMRNEVLAMLHAMTDPDPSKRPMMETVVQFLNGLNLEIKNKNIVLLDASHYLSLPQQEKESLLKGLKENNTNICLIVNEAVNKNQKQLFQVQREIKAAGITINPQQIRTNSLEEKNIMKKAAEHFKLSEKDQLVLYNAKCPKGMKAEKSNEIRIGAQRAKVIVNPHSNKFPTMPPLPETPKKEVDVQPRNKNRM